MFDLRNILLKSKIKRKYMFWKHKYLIIKKKKIQIHGSPYSINQQVVSSKIIRRKYHKTILTLFTCVRSGLKHRIQQIEPIYTQTHTYTLQAIFLRVTCRQQTAHRMTVRTDDLDTAVTVCPRKSIDIEQTPTDNRCWFVIIIGFRLTLQHGDKK